MEGNITTALYDGMNWIVTNSPNTTITIMAILGVVLCISIAFETATKFTKAIAYFFAVLVYYPYSYFKEKKVKK